MSRAQAILLLLEGRYYRGMTQAEFQATVGKGKGVKSTLDWSAPGEGTSFAGDYDTAVSYATVGRTDPRKTYRPVYVVEVTGDEGLTKNRQGYFYAYGEIPRSRVQRIWRIDANGNKLQATMLRQ